MIISGGIEVGRAHKVVIAESCQKWQHNSRCHISHPQGLQGRWENKLTKPSKYFSLGPYVSMYDYTYIDKWWWLSARRLQAWACSAGKPSSYFQNKGTLGSSWRPDREAASLRKLEAYVLLLPSTEGCFWQEMIVQNMNLCKSHIISGQAPLFP